MEQKAFLRIREISIEFPGVTIGMARLLPIFEGWVVKVKNAQNFEGEEGMNEAFAIAVQTTKHLAVWRDNESELWDVVEVFDDEDEATKAGEFHEQMSIYQIETGRLKWLK